MSNVFQNLQLQRIANAIEDGSVTGSITIDVTGAGDMQPATATAAGSHGLVPAPQAGDENKVLSGAGTWIDAGGGSGGSGTTYTVISDTTQTTNAWVNPIIVSCNPLDYDVIIFDITYSGDGRFYCITFPQTFPLDSGDGRSARWYALSNDFSCFPARLSNGMAMFTSTNVTLNVNKVTGIKFGRADHT